MENHRGRVRPTAGTSSDSGLSCCMPSTDPGKNARLERETATGRRRSPEQTRQTIFIYEGSVPFIALYDKGLGPLQVGIRSD